MLRRAGIVWLFPLPLLCRHEGALHGSSIAHERSWRIGHLLRQWPDKRGVMDFLVRQIESDDFITVGVDADTCFRTWTALNRQPHKRGGRASNDLEGEGRSPALA